MTIPYVDRFAAGEELAALLLPYAQRPQTLILALPRGGVPVGAVLAQRLHLPLDVLVVRKVGVPGHEELAMGAVASGDILILNEDIIARLQIPQSAIAAKVAQERAEVARREREYRDDRPPLPIAGHTIIIVDDGLATGSTMRAAIHVVRAQQPNRLVVAVPVAAPATCRDLAPLTDEMICAATPEPFFAVGQWYESFPQTTDAEVHELLARANHLKVDEEDGGVVNGHAP
jgi:putative phosphoribosyl transferase